MTAQLADVLAWVLIHSLWQGICVAAATCLLMRIIPARSANFRYVMCVVGMLTIVLGMLVTGAILTLEPQGSKVTSAAVNLEQRLNAPVPPDTPVVALSTAHRVHAHEVAGQSENRVNQPLSPVAPHWSQRWASWTIAAWLVGVAVMLLRTVAAIIQVRSWRKSIVVVDPQQLAPLAAILQQMCEQLGFRWVVRLVVSERVRVPAIVGVFAPCILVPAAMLTGVSVDHWQVILAHELAHIRRYDALVNLVQMLIESVLFFNPSVWWLSRQIRVEREACCDALAAKLCGESVVVARALVEFAAGLAESGLNIAVTPALATFADPAAPGDLTDRVHRLVEPDMAAHPRVSWGGLLVVMASLGFTAFALNWGTGVAVKTAARLISPQERVAELERLQNQATGDVFPPEPSDTAAATANGSQAVPSAPEKVVRQYAVTVVIRTFDGKPLAKEAYAMGVSRNGNFGTVSSLWHNYSQQSECRETFKYAPCELLIAARCRGYSDIVSPILDLRSGPLARTVELILDRSRTVKVLVRDESGRPVPGVRLKSSASIELGGTRGGFGPSELIADSGGVITMTGVGDLSYQLNVRAPGFEWQELIRDLSQVETMQVELKKGSPTLFNVIDAATGQPVSQARFVPLRVSSASNGNLYGDPRRQAVDAWSSFGETDAAGRLILDELNGQVQYAIGVLAEGYGLAVVQDVRAGQPPATVKMFPPFKLAGRIVGALDRLADTPSKSAAKPQRTFSYSYSFLKNNRNSGEQVTVDERGHFEIDNLSFGEEITLTLPDRNEKFVVTNSIPDLEFSVPSVSERAARDVLIHLTGTTAGAPARGTIRVDSTHPDPAVRLEFKPAQALLENEVMLNFPIGTQLRIQADKLVGYQIDPLQVEVVAGPRRQFIDIPARPAGGILTTILHADGSRATKGKVHVWAVKLPPGHNDNSKLNPSMQDPAAEILSSLPLGGSYRILAYEWNQDRVTAVVSDEVTLDESQPVAELQLQFKRVMPVSFEVRRPDGRPAQGATVALNFYFGLPKTSNFGSSVSCVTNDQGVAVFKDVVDVAAIAPLKCNMYVTVAPSDYRGWLGTLDLRHPEVIQLQPGVTASGVLVDAVSGKPIPHAAVRIGARDYGQTQYTGHLETTTDSQGVFQFQGLERIEYRVYLNGAVAPGTVVIPVPGREPRFEYPAGQQGLTLRGGDQGGRLKVVLYPGSPLKVAD